MTDSEISKDHIQDDSNEYPVAENRIRPFSLQLFPSGLRVSGSQEVIDYIEEFYAENGRLPYGVGFFVDYEPEQGETEDYLYDNKVGTAVYEYLKELTSKAENDPGAVNIEEHGVWGYSISTPQNIRGRGPSFCQSILGIYSSEK